MNPTRPGYKTTEGWLSTLASVFAVLVALKWVPITVSTAVQADAVKALPVIVVGYSIARSIAKVGLRRTLPLIESELGITPTPSSQIPAGTNTNTDRVSLLQMTAGLTNEQIKSGLDKVAGRGVEPPVETEEHPPVAPADPPAGGSDDDVPPLVAPA